MKIYIACGMLALALLAGCATNPERSVAKVSTTFTDLPTSVQRTVRNQAGDAKIGQIYKETLNGSPAYEISLVGPHKNRKIYVGEDGRLITTQARIYEESGAARVETK